MDSDIKIGADGIDAEALVKELRRRSQARLENGEFDSSIALEAERFNLSAINDSTEFFTRYLKGIRPVTVVDINDWPIVEKRSSRFSPILVRMKKTIRSLLRFYTYRMWSQQNIANDVFYTSISMLNERETSEIEKLTAKIEALEKRIAELEAERK